MSSAIHGVVFDKDGTLFDFGATWNKWAAQVLATLSNGDQSLLQHLADATDFDLDQRQFRPTSFVIAGTNQEVAECLAGHLPGSDVDEVAHFLSTSASNAPLVEATPLVPFLAGLAARDLALGVMTNDSEVAAKAHLNTVGVLQMFDFVAGSDSGFGAKPAPDPLLAFATAMGLAPENCVMVGDSTHDLIAGRAAGMRTVGVLTGPATRAELMPMADAVLPDIGHLSDWISAQA